MWTLPSFLFDEVSEQEWNAQGLPAALAVSAALALKVPFMPLCLDPHEQAGQERQRERKCLAAGLKACLRPYGRRVAGCGR